MRKKLRVLPHFILGLLVSYTMFAQDQKMEQQTLKVVNYNANVESPLTVEELKFITEVYGDKTEEDVLIHPQRVKDIKNILRNRVRIVNAGPKNLEGLPKLSSVELFNQNSLKNFVFNSNTFNPLKYNFNFYSRESSFYHVDNTSYYIQIKSQFE